MYEHNRIGQWSMLQLNIVSVCVSDDFFYVEYSVFVWAHQFEIYTVHLIV